MPMLEKEEKRSGKYMPPVEGRSGIMRGAVKRISRVHPNSPTNIADWQNERNRRDRAMGILMAGVWPSLIGLAILVGTLLGKSLLSFMQTVSNLHLSPTMMAVLFFLIGMLATACVEVLLRLVPTRHKS